MARYLYSELSSLIQARRNSANKSNTNLQHRDVLGDECAIQDCPYESDGGSAYCLEHKTPQSDWYSRHTDTILSLVRQHLPSGSGFDAGTKIDLDASHADKLVFTTSFHHMNDGGFYDGWTEHTVTVTPSLHGDFHLRISGRNRNDIKEMMYQDFDYALRVDVTYDLYKEHFPGLQISSKWEDADGKPSQCYQAFYVGEKRFHSSDISPDGRYQGSPLERARAYAGEEMYRRFMKR